MRTKFCILGYALASAFLMGAPSAFGGVLYSVRDAGVTPERQGEYDAMSFRSLMRIDGAGALLPSQARLQYDQESGYAGPLPKGSGHIVFTPTYSDNGKYGIGTSLATPDSQAFWSGFRIHDGKSEFLTPGTPATQPVFLNMAYAVNNSGAVAGMVMVQGGGNQAAVFNADGTRTLYESLGQGFYTAAFDINNLGQVVGLASIGIVPAVSNGIHGFVSQDGRIVDLNTLLDPASGWEILFASGINDAGQIAAVGVDGSGSRHQLVLTPHPVPEPTVLALAALTTTGAMCRRFRKSRAPASPATIL